MSNLVTFDKQRSAGVIAVNNPHKYSSIASWVHAVLLGIALLDLSGAARAQIVTEFSVGITAGAAPEGITAGPDGNLWFTGSGIDSIGRITTGAVAPIPALSEWGMILLLALLLLTLGAWRLRGRPALTGGRNNRRRR
ncbi:MAG: hypothetical protein ACRESZ_04040 [Methylococcales bacterium]